MKKIFTLLLGFFLLISISGCDSSSKEKTVTKSECNPIVGGSYNIIFETNNDNSIDNISVCIACSPDSYSDLPVLENDEFVFDGWYYDSEFTKKVEGTSTINVNPAPIYDSHDSDCIVGYKNITLYAKWN